MYTHVHGAVDLGDSLVVGRELIDLNAVAHQLTHDLNLKLVQLTLRDGVGLRNNWDNIHLEKQAPYRASGVEPWLSDKTLLLCMVW